MNKQEFYFRKPFVTAYEGESDGATTEPAPVATVVTEPKGQVADGKGKTFTQVELDNIVKERVEREKKVQKELVDKLSQLEQGHTLSVDERKKLQERITELNNEFMSKEAKAAKDLKGWEEKYNSDTTRLSKEKEKWQQDYFSYKMETELTEAALSNKARKPEQLVRLLKQDSKIKEVLDDKGNPTGIFETKVTVREKKEDGTYFTVELSPAQAMAKLRENTEEWGNQFNSETKDGTGQYLDLVTKPSDNIDGLKINGTYEEYKRSRETAKGKAQLGLNR